MDWSLPIRNHSVNTFRKKENATPGVGFPTRSVRYSVLLSVFHRQVCAVPHKALDKNQKTGDFLLFIYAFALSYSVFFAILRSGGSVSAPKT
jgi:hypothetical protein